MRSKHFSLFSSSLLLPQEKQDGWEIDVPGDHSCLFWAAVCSYLIPVIHGPAIFQQRCFKLFGDEHHSSFEKIRELFSGYNPFSNQQLFIHTELNTLIRETFRSRVVEYMAEHKDAFIDFWTPDENPKFANFNDYLADMHNPNTWGDNLVIRVINQLLGCAIHLESAVAGYEQDLPAANSNPEIITLVHINAANEKGEAANHYHFILDKPLGDTYQQIANAHVNNAPANPVVAPAINIETTNKTTQDIIFQHKSEDIHRLFLLYTDLNKLSFHHPGDITLEMISTCLLNISRHFNGLSWKNTEKKYIRNMYGKVNYAENGRRNTEYIDFEKMAYLDKFPDMTIQGSISEILAGHVDQFLHEIQLLKGNILFILHKELIDKMDTIHPLIQKKCAEIISSMQKEASPRPLKLIPLEFLSPLLDISYDRLFLQRMCDSSLIDALAPIPSLEEKDTLRWRYTFARVFTIMGETANNVSDGFKTKHQDLPLKHLKDLRSEFGHAHYTHIIKNGTKNLPQFIKIVEKDLFPLQQKLNDIVENLPTLNTPQIVEDIVRNYAISLAKQSQPLLIPVKPTVLRAGPTDKDIQLDEKYQREIQSNQNVQSTLRDKLNALPPPSPEEINKINLQLQRMEKRVNELITKLNNRKNNPTNSATEKPNVPKQPKFDPSRVIVNPNLSAFSDLLQYLKAKEVTSRVAEHPTPAARVNIKLTSLGKEIIRLRDFKLTIPVEMTRDYANEHSVTIIGQLIREINETKHLLLEEIQRINPLLKDALETNVVARHGVMHDAHNDQTAVLNDIIQNHTLPLLTDIKALEVITRPSQSENRAVLVLIQTYTEIALAYERVGLLGTAEQYFSEILAYTTPEHFAELHMEAHGRTFPKTSTPTITERIDDIMYVVSQGDQAVIAIEDLLWINHRVQALVHLGLCLMKQKIFDSATTHLGEAYKLYAKYSKHDKLLLTDIQRCLYIAKLENNPSQVDMLLPDIQSLEPIHYDGYVNVILTVANLKLKNQQYEAGMEILKKIDLEKTTQDELLCMYAYIDGLLCAGYAQECEKYYASQYPGTSPSYIIVDSAYEARQYAIIALDKAYQIFENNQAKFKTTHGHYGIRGIYEAIIYCLPVVMVDQAAHLLNHASPDFRQKGYELICKAVEIQKKFNGDISVSFQTLGAFCEKRYTETNDVQYLKTALAAHTKNTAHSDIHRRAMGYAGKATVLFMLARHIPPIEVPEEGFSYYSQAILACLDSLSYFSHIPADKKDEHDADDEDYLTDELKKMAHTHTHDYSQAIYHYQTLGEKCQEKGDTEQAIAYYQKCLLGLTYLPGHEWHDAVLVKLSQCTPDVSPLNNHIDRIPQFTVSAHIAHINIANMSL